MAADVLVLNSILDKSAPFGINYSCSFMKMSVQWQP